MEVAIPVLTRCSLVRNAANFQISERSTSRINDYPSLPSDNVYIFIGFYIDGFVIKQPIEKLVRTLEAPMIGLSPHELHLAHYSTQKIGQYSIAPKKIGIPYRNFYKGSSGKFLLGFDASQLYRALLTKCNNIYETQRCIGNAIDGRIYSPIILNTISIVLLIPR